MNTLEMDMHTTGCCSAKVFHRDVQSIFGLLSCFLNGSDEKFPRTLHSCMYLILFHLLHKTSSSSRSQAKVFLVLL